MKVRNLFIFLFAVELILITSTCSGGSSTTDDDFVVQTPNPPVEVNPPSAATLLYPENNEVCQTGMSVSNNQTKLNFQWNESNNTDSYDLNITNLDSNQQISFSGITETSKEVDLNKGTPYSWLIISKRSGTSVTATSNSWKFYLSGEGLLNYPPFPADLISPTSGKSFASTTTSVELSWEGDDPDGEILTYTLYFDNQDGLQTPSLENKNISSNSKNVNVNSGNTYYWRIKTTDTNENSSYSQVYSFIID